MKSSFKNLLVIVSLLVLTLGTSSCSYNSMVEKEEGVSAQWAQVENSYQRRADLVPNLVNTVKGYAAHEQETFTAVTEARAKATSMNIDPTNLTPETIKQYQDAQGELSVALGRLMRVNEAYPELKANTNFMALQDELTGTENRIAVERNKFNTKVNEYNSYIRKFPNNLVAMIFSFDKKGYFEADEGANKAPVVEF